MKNQQAWTFGVQVFFSTIVIGLCVVQIGFERDKDNLALYWGGLSGVLAYWLPSPASSQEDKQKVTLSTGGFTSADNGNNGQGNGIRTLAQGAAATVTTQPQE